MAIPSLDGETITVIHWRVVNNETGGIPFSISDREDRHAAERAKDWRARLGADEFHIEIWEQTWEVSPARWRRVPEHLEAKWRT